MPNNKIKGYLSVWIVANSGQVNSMFILAYRVYQYNFDETHKKKDFLSEKCLLFESRRNRMDRSRLDRLQTCLDNNMHRKRLIMGDHTRWQYPIEERSECRSRNWSAMDWTYASEWSSLCFGSGQFEPCICSRQ